MLNGINSVQKDDDRQIWRREWRYQKLDKENNFCIPFDYMTTEWPDIKMFDVKRKISDLKQRDMKSVLCWMLV